MWRRRGIVFQCGALSPSATAATGTTFTWRSTKSTATTFTWRSTKSTATAFTRRSTKSTATTFTRRSTWSSKTTEAAPCTFIRRWHHSPRASAAVRTVASSCHRGCSCKFCGVGEEGQGPLIIRAGDEINLRLCFADQAAQIAAPAVLVDFFGTVIPHDFDTGHHLHHPFGFCQRKIFE